MRVNKQGDSERRERSSTHAGQMNWSMALTALIHCLLLALSGRAVQQTTPEGVSWTRRRFSLGGVGSPTAQAAIWRGDYWMDLPLSRVLASWRCTALEVAKHVSSTYFPHQRSSCRRRS